MNQCYFQILFKAKPSPFQLDKATRNGGTVVSTQGEHQMDDLNFNQLPLTLLFFLAVSPPDDDDAAKPIMDVKGIMHSPNCDSVLVAEVSSIQFDTYYRKATNYVIMVTFVTCIQILLLIKQMEATNTQSVLTSATQAMPIDMLNPLLFFTELVHLLCTHREWRRCRC